MFDFPLIQTNFWDGVIAVPAVMLLTEAVKLFLMVPKHFIPYFALAAGLLVSLFLSHPNNFWGAVFMGYFYGYGAIGTYSSLKSSWRAFRKDRRIY
ncbi:hypothetical protein V1498_09160 [Peribacillus sp. SCS-26]|uniref:hypothetical protein n=1 Tax=Paraperibacillus marinus TaxID=3115295 RepID=UPI003905DDF2